MNRSKEVAYENEWFERRGRKPLFKDAMFKEGEKLAAMGMTILEIASFWNIARSTFNRWLKRHSEFEDTIKKGKIKADMNVTKSLYKRSNGYDFVETHFKEIVIGEGDKERTIKIKDKEITKHLPPDVAACFIWLKNRRPDIWRDRQEMGIEGQLNLDNKLTITVVHTDGSGKIETKEIEQIKAADFKELESPTNDGQKEG